jgi:hypothetical protein
MSEQLDWIEQAAQVGLQLKESIRQGHELLRDLKTVKRELDATQRAIRIVIDVDIPAAVQEAFAGHIGAQLGNYITYLEKLCSEQLSEMSNSSIEMFRSSMTEMRTTFDAMLETIGNKLEGN